MPRSAVARPVRWNGDAAHDGLSTPRHGIDSPGSAVQCGTGARNEWLRTVTAVRVTFAEPVLRSRNPYCVHGTCVALPRVCATFPGVYRPVRGVYRALPRTRAASSATCAAST